MKDSTAIPKAFLWRRLHSLTGLFIALYLFEHLLVNSQAALYLGEDGAGFIRAVNAIHELPYLPFIEAGLLGVPILAHAFLGIRYLFTGVSNSSRSNGSKPYLPYERNKAYSWQRITSWILLFTLAFHVIQMRFIDYPTSAKEGNEHVYVMKVEDDQGLHTLAKRLDVRIYNQEQIPSDAPWHAKVMKRPLKINEVVAVAPNFGTAELLLVRETFKMPFMIALYTIFVLAACFHAYNGLWTFMISWGVTLTQRSQRIMLGICISIMLLVAFFGLSAIFGTYWFNLKQ